MLYFLLLMGLILGLAFLGLNDAFQNFLTLIIIAALAKGLNLYEASIEAQGFAVECDGTSCSVARE